MKCPNCGVEVKENGNFCPHCGTKLRNECECWIKGGKYNCGESKCPGYGLFKKEKLQSK